MEWAIVFLWINFSLVQCVPINILGYKRNFPKLPSHPIVRRNAEWENYWAARSNYAHSYPEVPYYPPIHNPTPMHPHLSYGAYSPHDHIDGKSPMYVWSHNPVRKPHVPDTPAQPLNTWLSGKITPITYHSSENRHNQELESVVRRKYPVKTHEDVRIYPSQLGWDLSGDVVSPNIYEIEKANADFTSPSAELEEPTKKNEIKQQSSNSQSTTSTASPKYDSLKQLAPVCNIKVDELPDVKETFDHDDDDWEDCDECDDDDYDDYDDFERFGEPPNDLDQENMVKNLLDSIDSKFRALVFNPSAESKEKFQSCITPTNETGNCKYVQHCLLANVIGGIQQFMSYVCIINDRFIGVCCPDFPVSVVKVEWGETAVTEDNTTDTVRTPGECGRSSKTRVVGGSKADPAEYPWMAALLTMDKGKFFCGGSVVNNRYILTAAHCTFGIPRDQILVRLGEYDFGVEGPESPGEDYPVVEIKRHGLYSRRTLLHDIALLKLERDIDFNNRVGTICFPEKDEDFVGETATLAGWGNTKGGGPSSEVLLEAALLVANNSDCEKDHGLPVPGSFLCTKSEDKEKGACNGDSGGPLMLMNEETKEWKVIGLVSWGRRGCEPKFPTIYTRITDYLDWIRAHTT